MGLTRSILICGSWSCRRSSRASPRTRPACAHACTSSSSASAPSTHKPSSTLSPSRRTRRVGRRGATTPRRARRRSAGRGRSGSFRRCVLIATHLLSRHVICTHLPIPAHTCPYLPIPAQICPDLPRSAQICPDLPRSARICPDLPGSAQISPFHGPADPRWPSQALLVSTELIRVAILWGEMWHEALEQAYRRYFYMDDQAVDVMLEVLQVRTLPTSPATSPATSPFHDLSSPGLMRMVVGAPAARATPHQRRSDCERASLHRCLRRGACGRPRALP